MSTANGDNLDFLVRLSDRWAKKREEEAATMCAKRTPTKKEINRAIVISKWFFGWTDKTGPCPIGCMDEHWHKKLCALFEWIAVLETEAGHVYPSCANDKVERCSGSAYAPTLCSACGKPHGLTALDAGTDREYKRLCENCFKQNKAITIKKIEITCEIFTGKKKGKKNEETK